MTTYIEVLGRRNGYSSASESGVTPGDRSRGYANDVRLRGLDDEGERGFDFRGYDAGGRYDASESAKADFVLS